MQVETVGPLMHLLLRWRFISDQTPPQLYLLVSRECAVLSGTAQRVPDRALSFTVKGDRTKGETAKSIATQQDLILQEAMTPTEGDGDANAINSEPHNETPTAASIECSYFHMMGPVVIWVLFLVPARL